MTPRSTRCFMRVRKARMPRTRQMLKRLPLRKRSCRSRRKPKRKTLNSSCLWWKARVRKRWRAKLSCLSNLMRKKQACKRTKACSGSFPPATRCRRLTLLKNLCYPRKMPSFRRWRRKRPRRKLPNPRWKSPRSSLWKRLCLNPLPKKPHLNPRWKNPRLSLWKRLCLNPLPKKPQLSPRRKRPCSNVWKNLCLSLLPKKPQLNPRWKNPRLNLWKNLCLNP